MKHTYIKKTKCKTLGNKFKSLRNQAIFYSRYIITSSLIIPFLTISSTRCTCRFLYMGWMEWYTIFITNKIIPLRCINIKPFDCIIPCKAAIKTMSYQKLDCKIRTENTVKLGVLWHQDQHPWICNERSTQYC